MSGDGENELKVWDTETGAELQTLTGHAATVTSVAFDPLGKQMVSASSDGTLRCWDASTFQPRRIIQAHADDVASGRFP